MNTEEEQPTHEHEQCKPMTSWLDKFAYWLFAVKWDGGGEFLYCERCGKCLGSG